MVHIGNVTLPDGRIVHGTVHSSYERDTNATNVSNVEIEWPDGTPLDGDDYNIEFVVGGREIYLHEFVTDVLLLMPGEYPDDF